MRNELIEKYDIKNFRDLLSVCLGEGITRQKAFIEYLKESANSNFDVDVPAGKLFLGDMTFDVEFIGTASQRDDTWLWADANRSFMPQHVETIKQLYSIGQTYNIKEFLESKILLDNEITAHNLSSIACVLLSRNLCYYVGASNGITLSMFVKNLPQTLFNPIDVIKFNSTVLECISVYNLNDKLFIQSFLESNKCTVNIETNKIIGIWDNGNKYIVEFDENGKFKNGNMIAERAKGKNIKKLTIQNGNYISNELIEIQGNNGVLECNYKQCKNIIFNNTSEENKCVELSKDDIENIIELIRRIDFNEKVSNDDYLEGGSAGKVIIEYDDSTTIIKEFGSYMPKDVSDLYQVIIRKMNI